MNASALFLLLILNLVLIGRQDQLKRREVERRLRGIIDQIQGGTKARACQEGRDALGTGCLAHRCCLCSVFWGSWHQES